MKERSQMTHQQAHAALQAAADGLLDQEQQRTLEMHLKSCTDCQAYAASLSALETRLSDALQKRWPEVKPSRGEFASLLGNLSARNRRQIMRTRLNRWITGLAWAGAAVLLVILLSWSMRTLLPAISQSSTPTPIPTQALVDIPTPTSSPAKGENTPMPGGASLFPNVTFDFAVAMPVTPTSLTVYTQLLPQALTPENALDMANRLGVSGSLYQSPSEGGPDQIVYEVNDGFNSIRFIHYAGQFVYESAPKSTGTSSVAPLSFQELSTAAEVFLKSHGLLEGDYRAEPAPGSEYNIRFVRLVDGLPVIYGSGENWGQFMWLDVGMGKDGQVENIYASLAGFTPLGSYPILTAQEAWRRLSDSDALQRSVYAILGPEGQGDSRTWSRSYLPGKIVDLYGYARSLQAAQPAQPPLVQVNGYTLLGDAQTLSKIPMGAFLHLRGLVDSNDRRQLSITLEAWEEAARPEEYLDAEIQRQGEAALIITSDGRTLELPDIPMDLPDKAKVYLTGVSLPDKNRFEWRMIELTEGANSAISGSYGTITSCFGGGGGGGGGPATANFGGGGFALLNINEKPQTTPTIEVASPLQVGMNVEGLSGVVWVGIFHQQDGSSNTEVSLYLTPADDLPGGLSANLEGAGLSGIETLQNLPIKVWGKVVRDEQGTPVIAVDRYEEVYPGVRIQAWQGREEAVMLEGRQVAVFTSLDGQRFVLKSSLDAPAKESLIGIPGSLVIREGYLEPGNSFAGLPVMTELSASMLDEEIDLSGYVINSSQPVMIPPPGEYGPKAEDLQGRVTINEIILAYSAISLGQCSPGIASNPEIGPWLVVQPVWVFRGVFDDGRRFEVQVQALPDEYLVGR